MNIPYQLTAAVPVEQRHRYMGHALSKGYPRLGKTPIEESNTVSIACYGPSLRDTWQALTRPIISVSGTLHFLTQRGIVPDYHVAMDPRLDSTPHLEPPIPGVHYLMASVCHPHTWEILRGHEVTLWHGESDRSTLEWLTKHDPGQHMLKPGSNVGLGAIQVGGMLGARHFEIHGMDGSIRDGQRHAGPHYGHQQGGITWDVNQVTYQTSRIMANGVAEMMTMLEKFPIFCVFHGDGLTQALVRKYQPATGCCADETQKADTLRKAHAVIYGGLIPA